MQQQVRLVFLGETLQGFDAKQVRRRVGRELGLDKARLARLFSGRRIVIKRAVDAERAFRHVDRFARVGARLRIELLDTHDAPESEAGVTNSQEPDTATPLAAPAAVPVTAATPTPAALPAAARRSSRGSGRSRRSRRRARWVAALAFVGLLVAVAALAAFVLLPSDVLQPRPAARTSTPAARAAPPVARAPRPDTAALAAKAWPQLTGAAAQIYRELYQPARGHKAFAAAPDGRWGWTGEAPTAAAAVDAARAACEVGRLPEAPHCEVLSVDGEDPPRVPAPASPSSAPR